VPSTVLVVDDEATLRETLAWNLEQEGYRVISAADGRAALQRFRADRPDLVILDLMLPELGGVEVCRRMRAESSVPILMLTARDSEVDKIVGFEVGADDYVTKPFSLRELVARVRALLRRAESAPALAAPGPPVPVGLVEVDRSGRRVLRGGEPVPVTPRAYALLAFLLANRGRAFSREQLLEQVWGYDFAGETRTVDVHVHWLRRLIEEDPARPTVLETVRGVGYVLR
jgi:two-component system alkaline phosphatase synthesis response regulator PhoP